MARGLGAAGAWGRAAVGLSTTSKEVGVALFGESCGQTVFVIQRSIKNICWLKSSPEAGGRSVPGRRHSGGAGWNFPCSLLSPSAYM